MPPLPRPPGGSHETDARPCRGGESIENTLAHARMYTLALVFQSGENVILSRRAAHLVQRCSFPLPLNQQKTPPPHFSAEAPRATFHLFPLLGIHLACTRTESGGPDTVIPGRYERPQIPIRSVQHSQRFFSPFGHPTFNFFAHLLTPLHIRTG